MSHSLNPCFRQHRLMNTMRRFDNNQHVTNAQQSIAARRRCYKRPFQKISTDGPATRPSSEPGARRTDATQRTVHSLLSSRAAVFSGFWGTVQFRVAASSAAPRLSLPKAWGWQSSKSGATIPKSFGFEAATPFVARILYVVFRISFGFRA